jgi:hypothetical protein
MEEFIKKLINTDISRLSKNDKMSLTFTEEEVKQLEDSICDSSAKRSYTSHKRDMKKFILAYFEKKRKGSTKKSPSADKKNGSSKKSQEKKSLNGIKKSNSKNKSSNSKEPKDGYKIVKVSKNYEFPNSIYKKDTPEEAAKSALKGIIRKNDLDDKHTFTFSITSGEKSYKYTTKNGKLEAH